MGKNIIERVLKDYDCWFALMINLIEIMELH
jgi:hypothetical protein